jgi:DNA repair exonuclease SbcCD ATPase subunit
MLISEITLRNFKSYGNNKQTLKLNTEKGDLILMVGKNGSGKSSLIESIDYVLYNKVKGVKRKWLTLSSLPNRINNELSCSIKFNSNGTDVEVVRGQNPSTLDLIENGIKNERAGKKNVNNYIEKYVGLDIDSFKSFISMSINDFKNFINLSNEEKKLLLDKLFNLETINTLNDILKSMTKENKTQIQILDKEISTLKESILSINKSIQKSKEKRKENLSTDIENIKSGIMEKKGVYEKLKSKTESIQSKEDELNDTIDSEKSSYLDVKSEMRSIDKQLKLYDDDVCPYCSSDLTSGNHINIKDSLVDKKSKFEDVKVKLEEKLQYLKDKKKELNTISGDVSNSFMDVKSTLRNLKKDLDKLNEKKDKNSDDDTDIDEFLNTVKDLESQGKKSKGNLDQCKEKLLYQKELSNVFSEGGVKKTIIKNILDPINHFISENLSKMNMRFTVSLDDTFSATIKHLGMEVDQESLSTGETKKVNIAIMIAYLKLIRTKRNINVLFLDEVFASIDVEGVYDILELLRKFANDYNINIFLVHHSILNNEYFDRIIRINKEVFSQIEEVYNESDNEIESES